VVGDGREVERPRDADLTRAATLRVQRREPQRLPAREGVRLVGRRSRVERPGIVRQRRVNVQVPEKNTPLGRVILAARL
jgi:hypothetical protein